ncbi:chemotaxis protein CheX [Azovibrio restrictus]|uniref:chemotaxis protein CheX n=1 Tax=Azovibrio restrictus TaxID=146938 RepID=UPI0004206E36|nr:chemotaxis protein CheX [Azovibrio restrictus]
MTAPTPIKKALKPADVEVFAETIGHYFERITGEKALVRTAYLLETEAPPQDDFNGMIIVHGSYQGSVCFAAPRGLLTHVLMRMGQQEYSDADHLDIVGEIANTLAGRARRVLGEGLEITPPHTYTRAGRALPSPASGTPLVIPFTWQIYAAVLVVHLDVLG